MLDACVALRERRFKPFTSTAWWAIAGLVMYMSCALYLMEPDEIDIDDISFLDRFTDVIGIQNDRYWWLATLDNVMTFGAKCTYFGVTAFTSGAPVQEASNFPSRVISAGFATFGLIIVSQPATSQPASQPAKRDFRLDCLCLMPLMPCVYPCAVVAMNAVDSIHGFICRRSGRRRILRLDQLDR